MKYFVTLLFVFYIAANYGQPASISQSTSIINGQSCVKTCTDGSCQTSCSPVDSNNVNNCVICNNNVCTTCDKNPEEAKRIQAETKQRIDEQQEQLRQQMSNMNNQFRQMDYQFQENMRRFQQQFRNPFNFK